MSFCLMQLCFSFGFSASLHHFCFLFAGIWVHLRTGANYLFAGDSFFRGNFDWPCYVKIC